MALACLVKLSFDAERNARGHAGELWAVAPACQKVRHAVTAKPTGVRARVIG